MSEDQKNSTNEKPEEKVRELKMGRNMYTSTIGLKPIKPWDPMKTEPLTTAEIGL